MKAIPIRYRHHLKGWEDVALLPISVTEALYNITEVVPSASSSCYLIAYTALRAMTWMFDMVVVIRKSTILKTQWKFTIQKKIYYIGAFSIAAVVSGHKWQKLCSCSKYEIITTIFATMTEDPTRTNNVSNTWEIYLNKSEFGRSHSSIC